MPLTREFKETVQARIARDPAYRKELLREGVGCLLAGDLSTGKAILRDYINATIGFEELSHMTHTPSKSLMRMFGPKGNPQARNLFEVIAHLQRTEGIRSMSAAEASATEQESASTQTDEPVCNAIAAQTRYARLSVHRGSANLQVDGVIVKGVADFMLPVEGHAIVAFRSESEQLTGDFASDLLIDGVGEIGTFRIHCPQCYTRRQAGGTNAGWSLISPVNRPVRIAYGSARLARRCKVLLNNFAYECGDAVITHNGSTREGTPLTAEASGRRIEFRWRHDRQDALSLVQADILASASLTEFSFDALDGEDDDQLMDFALDVAAICTFATGASVTVAMIEMLDVDGAIARRVVTQPVHSRYHANEIVSDFHLPRLFRETFETYVKMRQSHLPWRKLQSYCGSIEDCPYLEQKFASLVMALEFFVRNCLIEGGRPEKDVSRLSFPDLIGATRKHLGWHIPKHYTAGEASRLLRNSVVHGGGLPTKDNVEFRRQFDKWRLFLFRRVLIRLGYSGEVVSPHQGVEASSPVGEFSPEHNSFATTGAAANSLVQLMKELRTRAQPGRQQSDGS